MAMAHTTTPMGKHAAEMMFFIQFVQWTRTKKKMISLEDSLISANDIPEERHDEWLPEWRTEDNEMIGWLVPIPDLLAYLEKSLPEDYDEGNFNIFELNDIKYIHSSKVPAFIASLGFQHRKRTRLEKELEDMFRQADSGESEPNRRNPLVSKRKRPSTSPLPPLSFDDDDFSLVSSDGEEEEKEPPRRRIRFESVDNFNMEDATGVLVHLETSARILEMTNGNENLGDECANMAMQVARRSFNQVISQPSERANRVRMWQRIREMGYNDKLPLPQSRTDVAIMRIGKEANRLHQVHFGRSAPRIYEGPEGTGVRYYDTETAPHTLDVAIRTILDSYEGRRHPQEINDEEE